LFHSTALHAVNPTDPEGERPFPQSESPDSPKELLNTSVDVTTNYVFRGISNSNNKPAIQGSLTFNDVWMETGTYVNFFTSNVHLKDHRNKIEHFEIDTTAGYTNTIGDNFNYDVHIVRYNYPDSKGLSYAEGVGSVQYYFLTALVAYSSNAYDEGKNGYYMNMGFKQEIPKDWIELSGVQVSGGVGYSKLSRRVGLRSYADYNLQISKTVDLSKSVNMNIALQWTNTNHKSADASKLKRNHVFGTLTLSF
jgi:uncharacterized protein (TIGR02001 family)